MNTTEKRSAPKRFIDRKDLKSIVNSVEKFTHRDHNNIPKHLYYLLVILLMSFSVVIVYVSKEILKAQSQKVSVLYLIEYLLLSFAIVAAYSLFLVRRLKLALNATEFVSLSVTRTLERYSNCFCLISNQGKVFYYNDSFIQNCLVSNDVETQDFNTILNKSVFDEKALGLIKDSIQNTKDNSFTVNLNGSKTANVFPLSRPQGIFAINIF